jgi:hypothetical protein
MLYLIVYFAVMICWFVTVGVLYRQGKCQFETSVGLLAAGLLWPISIFLTIVFYIVYIIVETIRTVVAIAVWAILGEFPRWDLWGFFRKETS